MTQSELSLSVNMSSVSSVSVSVSVSSVSSVSVSVSVSVPSLKVEDLKVEDLKVEDLKVVDLKVVDLKVVDLKVEDLKVVDLKVGDLKVVDLKVEDLKVEDLKVEDLKVEDLKVGEASLRYVVPIVSRAKLDSLEHSLYMDLWSKQDQSLYRDPITLKTLKAHARRVGLWVTFRQACDCGFTVKVIDYSDRKILGVPKSYGTIHCTFWSIRSTVCFYKEGEEEMLIGWKGVLYSGLVENLSKLMDNIKDSILEDNGDNTKKTNDYQYKVRVVQ